MAESKMFTLEEGMTAESVGRGLEIFFREKKKFVVEGMVTPEGYLVQAKEEQSWKKFAGMDQATQVQIFQSTSESITVNVGTGKWIDKAAAAGVGAIVFAPLLATAAFGVFKQQQLPQEIFDAIEHYIQTGGKVVTVSMSGNIGAVGTICSNCHAQNPEGTKFCSSCGQSLMDACPNCQASIDKSTKFCPECGTNVQETKEKHCENCQTVLAEDAKFCPECGTSARE
ncbi:zinc ribbon domain-containing protein [Candidatus Enterococcus ferrettii]|uniref:DZANK-type domain-containing protein n=1 Tax=Candidatus Enterococcus ferrettii TaxID=2815324 RepID=A0ABV0EQH6_9ENTE|nr:zinc ribbon domain-containing protein [Enterococcus sp. 665A]MBO1342708.1 zinc ribbon domain-containing protein [Enterococcus sp. 665A]